MKFEFWKSKIKDCTKYNLVDHVLEKEFQQLLNWGKVLELYILFARLLSCEKDFTFEFINFPFICFVIFQNSAPII